MSLSPSDVQPGTAESVLMSIWQSSPVIIAFAVRVVCLIRSIDPCVSRAESLIQQTVASKV